MSFDKLNNSYVGQMNYITIRTLFFVFEKSVVQLEEIKTLKEDRVLSFIVCHCDASNSTQLEEIKT